MCASTAELDRTENWGKLGDRDTWTKTESILKRLVYGLLGQTSELRKPEISESELDSADGSSSDNSDQAQSQTSTSSASSDTSSGQSTTFSLLNQSSQRVQTLMDTSTGLDGIPLDELLPKSKRPAMVSRRKH